MLAAFLESWGSLYANHPLLRTAVAFFHVAGLVAATLNITDKDFTAGRMKFGDTPNAAALVNQGTISTPAGGQVVLLAPRVENSGIITSPKGEVILAAGRSVELVDVANPQLRVVIDAPAGISAMSSSHAFCGEPLISTVQAEHSSIPQPNLVPVRPMMSRSTHSNGVAESQVTVWFTPFTLSVVVMSAIRCASPSCSSHRSE